MEPLKRIKPVQVLTDESIFEIQRAVIGLEVYSEQFPNERVADNIAKLKELIEELKS